MHTVALKREMKMLTKLMPKKLNDLTNTELILEPLEFLNGAFYQEREAYKLNPTYEPNARGARLAAATKRFKTDCMLSFVEALKHQIEADITPTAAARLCQGFFGRKGSQAKLVFLFGTRDRQHRSDHSNQECIDAIIARFSDRAAAFWLKVNLSIEEVKRKHDSKIGEQKRNKKKRKKG